MPTEPQPPDFKGTARVNYPNRSYHQGQNTRLEARLITDNEATQLTNVDVSIPGIRTKRLGPKAVTTSIAYIKLDAPTGLEISSPTCASCPSASSSILTPTFSWNAVANASGYVVNVYAGGACGGAPVYTSSTVLTTSFTMPSPLTTCTSYSWNVTAKGTNFFIDSDPSSCCAYQTIGVACLSGLACGNGTWAAMPTNIIVHVVVNAVSSCSPYSPTTSVSWATTAADVIVLAVQDPAHPCQYLTVEEWTSSQTLWDQPNCTGTPAAPSTHGGALKFIVNGDDTITITFGAFGEWGGPNFSAGANVDAVVGHVFNFDSIEDVGDPTTGTVTILGYC